MILLVEINASNSQLARKPEVIMRGTSLSESKEDLAKSNDYYHKIHPVEAAAVDKNLADAAAAAEAKKKAAAEAAAKAAAAKAAAAKIAPAQPAAASPSKPEA